MFSTSTLPLCLPFFVFWAISQNYKRLCYRQRVWCAVSLVCICFLANEQKGLVINFDGGAFYLEGPTRVGGDWRGGDIKSFDRPIGGGRKGSRALSKRNGNNKSLGDQWKHEFNISPIPGSVCKLSTYFCEFLWQPEKDDLLECHRHSVKWKQICDSAMVKKV